MRLLWCWAILPFASAVLRCAQVERQKSPAFQLVRRCSRSAMSVVAQSNATSARRCADFAYSRRGLAFNFSPRGAPRSDPASSSCLVLQCPEFQGLGSLQRDEGYDYYSMYFDPMPNVNWTCVPGVGMFSVRSGAQRANFTLAGQRCRDDNGDLAHVLSDARTAGLSSLLNSTRGNIRRAFANLNDMKKEGLFVTSADEPLVCFPYRAWGSGEPRNRSKGEDCVVLDRRQVWAVTSCARRLPFICELFPGGGNCSQVDGDPREECAELQWLRELQGSDADRCEGWDLLATPTTTTTTTTSSTTPPLENEGEGEDHNNPDEDGDEGVEDTDLEDEGSGGSVVTI